MLIRDSVCLAKHKLTIQELLQCLLPLAFLCLAKRLGEHDVVPDVVFPWLYDVVALYGLLNAFHHIVLN